MIVLHIRRALVWSVIKKLMKKLYLYGIRELANNILQSYLNDRMQFVSTNTTNSSLKKKLN